ncbi:hypothetical protein S2E19_03628 [Bacillus mycoides]|nr:hypothetical protein BTJ44_02709 [Bacillus mycoides]OSY09095.1 hypothetical protein S2E19_03628 [Bacillus mycoides]OSY15266.1 hypothetical protein BTJ48_03686 [Bacillus mycoides]
MNQGEFIKFFQTIPSNFFLFLCKIEEGKWRGVYEKVFYIQ